jgi:hypothetical protein
MKRLRPRLPSPAMAVALVALFISLGGVSWGVASGKIGTRQIRNNSIRSVDIRNGQVTSRDLRNNDVRGKDVRNNSLTGRDVLESSLAKVPSASQADMAFSPVAYARVSAGGQVIASSSRGVTNANITVESTSAYCFRNLPFQFKTAQATIDFQSAASQQPSLGARAVASVALGNPFNDCSGSGVQLEVVTARADTATYVRSGFFVVFWN